MAPPLPLQTATSSYAHTMATNSRTLTALNTMLANDTDPNTFGYSLHVHVPPLPSPDTTAAAAALFRVNQMTTSHMLLSPTEASYDSKLTIQRYEGGERQRERERERERGYAASYNNKGKRQRSVSSLSYTTYSQNYDREREHAGDCNRAVPLEPLAIPPSSTSTVIPIETNTTTPASTNLTPGTSEESGNTSWTSSTSADARGKRNVGIPKFLRFLFQMLEQEDGAIIAWSHQGTAFQIKQPDVLAQVILPKYFKHNKVSSFQRQLNYFGFKKWTKTQTTICTFSHPSFRRDDRDKMLMIKRNERVKGEEPEPEKEEEGFEGGGGKRTKVMDAKRSRHVHSLVIQGRDDRSNQSEQLSSESIARMLRPTISPSSTAASASIVSLATSMPSSNSAFGRLVDHSTAVLSSEPSNEIYRDTMCVQSDAVMHSSPHLNQAQDPPLYHRQRRASVFDMSPPTQWTSTSHYTATNTVENTTVYDTDPMGMLMNNSLPLGRSSPPPPSDYLDVLLEGANMEESHTSTSSESNPSASWEPNYDSRPLEQSQPQHILAATSTFRHQSQSYHQH